jgi:hypothetical protein
LTHGSAKIFKFLTIKLKNSLKNPSLSWYDYPLTLSAPKGQEHNNQPKIKGKPLYKICVLSLTSFWKQWEDSVMILAGTLDT